MSTKVEISKQGKESQVRHISKDGLATLTRDLVMAGYRFKNVETPESDMIDIHATRNDGDSEYHWQEPK